MTFKKALALLLALVLMTAVFAACGSNTPASNNNGGNNSGNNAQGDGKDTASDADAVIFRSENGPANVGAPEKTLDPKSVYASMTYTPEMFYGDHRIQGSDEIVKQTAAALPLIDFKQEYSKQITLIPHRIKAGDKTLSHMVSNIREYDWLEAHFLSEKQYLVTLLCAYTVEGHTLTLRPITNWKYIQEENKGVYEFRDEVLTYDFSFSGTALTLTKDGSSLTLESALDAEGQVTYMLARGYLSGAEPAGNIGSLMLRWEPAEGGKTGFYNEFLREDGSRKECRDGVATLNKGNGLLTLTLAVDEEGTMKTSQYVFFYCGSDGFVLTDGSKNYYYNFTSANESISDRLARSLTAEELVTRWKRWTGIR